MPHAIEDVNNNTGTALQKSPTLGQRTITTTTYLSTIIMRRRTYNSQSSTTSQLALAAFWQSQLQVVCQTAEFLPAGRRDAAVSTTPSSLITIEPFTPGGLRRFCINVHSKLIQELANALRAGHEDMVARMGCAMISSGSWPVPGIDGDFAFLHWKMPPGLIATPDANYVWPVPHEEVNSIHHYDYYGRSQQKPPAFLPPLHTALAIWPRRICKIDYKLNVGDPAKLSDPTLKYVAAVWVRRDQALQLELQHLLQQHRQSRTNRCHGWWRGRRRHETQDDESSPCNLKQSSLLTYAPSLPILCVAQVLQQDQRIPRHLANAEAAALLIQNDRIFALSLFFGVPLIDRTRTLHGALRTAPLVRPPPTRQEIEQFQSRYPSNDPHACLKDILIQRAQALWNLTETNKHQPGNIYVAWSGGIDSTAVLCALLQTADASSNKRRQRIRVVLGDGSISENPLFYQKFIQEQRPSSLAQIPINDKALSWHEAIIRQENPANIFVTGELGDQLFGSDRCAAAFPEAYGGPPKELPPNLAKAAPKLPPPEYQGIFCDKGLAAPWQETMLPSLDSVGLLAEGGPDAWQKWIAPQLELAPFPIVSTYDFFWWLNFSMKWQNVSLRSLHDGGEPLLERAHNLDELIGCIHHFFDDRDMECWSCIKEFHPYKFPDLTNWTTYKEPLKYFIRDFDGDEDYYRDKLKVGSLGGVGAPFEADAYVTRFFGALAELEAPREQAVEAKTSNNESAYSGSICRTARPSLLSWGANGLLIPESEHLSHLLHPDMSSVLHAYPNNAPEVITVTPWTEGPMYGTSPFHVAPFFAEDDERQRRVFNPVTAATLVGKCAALMETNLLKNRTFLDLGACLGASTHWALCMGATNATAVDIQGSFCDRARAMLQRAEALDCWPSILKTSKPPFNVVQSDIREYLSRCADRSHDVVLGAGLLHCFLDPIQVLMDMARVATHAVLLEMLHPALYLNGYVDDPDNQRSFSNISDLSASVRPPGTRIEKGGLLQILPSALVNMADKEASFQGLAILPSRLAIESVMKNLGFKVTRVQLKADHPAANDDLITYTGPRGFKALSSRYFLRCVRIENQQEPNICSLESVVSKDDRSKAFLWKEAKSWSSWDSGSRHSAAKTTETVTSKKATTFNSVEVCADPSKKWEFDKTVAKRFEREAKCHIPDYEEVVQDSISLLESEMKKRAPSLTKESLKVVDIGCATGYTLIRLLKHGFQNVHGVDTSLPMLETARDNVQSAGSEESVNLHLSQNPLDLPTSLGEDLDAAFVNWTLQFVPAKDNRKSFLKNISNRMKNGALLVLTEKTVQDSLTKEAYYGFKKKNGISEDEIMVKESKLKGVLEPFSLPWYFDALSECGFGQVSLFRARFGFVTFLARKEGRAAVLKEDSTSAMMRSDDKFERWLDVSKSAKDVLYETMEHADAPFVMRAWGESTNSTWAGGSKTGTVYGFVYNGPTKITFGSNRMSFELYDSMYFACPGEHVSIQGGSGVLFIAENHRSMFALGGPVEAGEGHLPYIDGCTDSLLLSPTIKGSPCLNHLHFPPGVVQTRHTHPSGRAGIVIRGKGVCVYENTKQEIEKVPLQPGMVFVIPSHLVHAFETDEDHELDVVAFHPDSDFGPSSTNHPMINRTIVDGVSASEIGSIQTKRSIK